MHVLLLMDRELNEKHPYVTEGLAASNYYVTSFADDPDDPSIEAVVVITAYWGWEEQRKARWVRAKGLLLYVHLVPENPHETARVHTTN